MADITVHIPDDRVSEFYLMLGSWLAQGTGPQPPAGGTAPGTGPFTTGPSGSGPSGTGSSSTGPAGTALQDWTDSDSDLDRARTVWREFSTRAKDAVLVLLDYPGEAITGQDLAPAAGISEGAHGVAQALAQAAQQCTAAGRRTPWREQILDLGGSTYWIEGQAADLFRRLEPELPFQAILDVFGLGEDRPKPRRSTPPR
jgi:hypothetical protein